MRWERCAASAFPRYFPGRGSSAAGPSLVGTGGGRAGAGRAGISLSPSLGSRSLCPRGPLCPPPGTPPLALLPAVALGRARSWQALAWLRSGRPGTRGVKFREESRAVGLSVMAEPEDKGPGRPRVPGSPCPCRAGSSVTPRFSAGVGAPRAKLPRRPEKRAGCLGGAAVYRLRRAAPRPRRAGIAPCIPGGVPMCPAWAWALHPGRGGVRAGGVPGRSLSRANRCWAAWAAPQTRRHRHDQSWHKGVVALAADREERAGVSQRGPFLPGAPHCHP